MAIYTVHVPDAVSDLVTQADRTAFIREGFSVWAFLLGPVYLLWHRLWVAFAVWIVLALAVTAIALVLHPPIVFPALLAVVIHLYLGLEAHDLRRWKLDQLGFRFADLVSAAGLDEAELMFFGRLPASRPQPRPVQRWAAVPAAPGVIGFPDGSGA